MNISFYGSLGRELDAGLAEAIKKGVSQHGHECRIAQIGDVDRVDPWTDVAIVVGVKGKSKPYFMANRKAGKHAIIIDKGYTRLRGPLGSEYWRVSVDHFQPHAYFQRKAMPGDRWGKIDWPILPMRQDGRGEVLFAGSSQKYCNWHELGEATDYATDVLTKLSRLTNRPLAYRPKPSWDGAVPIPGSRYSSHEERFPTALAQSYMVVTFGSNAAFEALLNGVPVMVLGDGIAKPLARTRLEQVEDPRYPSLAEVRQLAHDLAYCQWSLREMENGTMWSHVEEVITYCEGR